MYFDKKQKEVEFFLDRTRESLLVLLRSIVSNPTITEMERLQLVAQIADEFGGFAGNIQGMVLSSYAQVFQQVERLPSEATVEK